jgi:hypothetical protein
MEPWQRHPAICMERKALQGSYESLVSGAEKLPHITTEQ